jgi:hypothetical protein
MASLVSLALFFVWVLFFLPSFAYSPGFCLQTSPHFIKLSWLVKFTEEIFTPALCSGSYDLSPAQVAFPGSGMLHLVV